MFFPRGYLLFCIILPTIINAKESGNIHSMYTMDQVPFGFISKSGKTSGVLFDILNQIIIKSGLETSHDLIPAKRLGVVLSYKKGGCSLLADVKSVVDNFDLVEPIGYQFQSGILPKSGVMLDNYASLKGKVLAVPLGISFHERFDKDSELSKVRPPKFLNAIRMLKRGRVDGILGSIPTLMHIAFAEGMFHDDLGVPLILAKNDVYLVCSKVIDKKARSKLRQAVIELKLSGVIHTTLEKYFGSMQYSKVE